MRLTVAEAVWRGGTDAAKVPAPVLPSQDRRLPKSSFFGSGKHNQFRPFPQQIRRGAVSRSDPRTRAGVEADEEVETIVQIILAF
jgi:hypothetical protein